DMATATVTVNVTDDVPTAVADLSLTVTESDGATSGVNLLTNDTQGADGATVTHVDLGSGFVALTSGANLGGGVFGFTTAKGSYTFKADGTWTFDPAANQNNAVLVNADFSYRITDGDGDTSTATHD
ncbi:MAG: Ig-like domain-containing protein, partial [Pseudomonadota bacterium]